jgi:hypothetical protein
MSFLLFVRRLHLYLGLFLLPWVVLFGITSWPFSHPAQVQPKWTVRIDRSYALDVAPGADLRAIGARIHEDAGFRGGFYVNRPNPQRINVHHPDFFHPTRITYFVDQGRLLAEEREFVLRQALTSMHAHAGYDLGGFWNILWAIVVDILCVALVLWIATGIVMWWMLPGSRAWGWLAIASGIAVFAVLVARL